MSSVAFELSTDAYALRSSSYRDSQSSDLDLTAGGLSDDDQVDKISSFRKLSRYTNDELHIRLWDDCVTENVTSLPFDLIGFCKFEIQCKREDMMIVTKDGKPCSKWIQSSRKYFKGVRRIARCKGFYACEGILSISKIAFWSY